MRLGPLPTQPTGTVWFLFTDIEGSTRLWEQYPDRMRDVLARHDDLLREEIARNDGYVFTTAGDAFSAAFSDPLAGVMAAIDAQSALAAEPWEVEEVKFGCRSTPASLMNAMATTSVRRSTARRESFQPVKVVRCS